jgi:hypothetical protein
MAGSRTTVRAAASQPRIYRPELSVRPYFFGTFQVPVLLVPQPMQGEFPSYPLASQSKNFESWKNIFRITDFGAALICLWFCTSTPI